MKKVRKVHSKIIEKKNKKNTHTLSFYIFKKSLQSFKMTGLKVLENSAVQDTHYQAWWSMLECDRMMKGRKYGQGKSNIAPIKVGT